MEATSKFNKDTAKSTDFLVPSERKYPYKIDGRISGSLLKEAMKSEDDSIRKRARSIYEDHCI